MKTQISRDGFRPDRRYSGVYQQQGRMITDRDWNELVDILKTRVDEALVDVIGTGTPKGRAVTVQMAGNTPRLVPGYVYAGGLAGFVEPVPDAPFPFGLHQQKGFPSAPPLPPAGTAYRLYADVWERPVVSLEDEDLRDLALHGADTCTRTQVMAQIKTCPVALDPRFLPGAGSGLLTLRFPAAGGQLDSDPCDPQTQEVDPVGGDFLFRLEVHDVRWPAGGDPDLPERVVVKWSRENGAEQYAFKDAPDWFSAGPWIYELHTVESEQHLGYHVPALGNNQSWAPKRGTLETPLPTTAPEGTLVRRWDGYLVLVQSGGVWSVSSVNGETADVTAPGATVTFQTVQHGEIFRAAAKIALADLEILLEVEGAVFLPGDYWSAPVRRAAHEAGKELLTEAFPTGIVHRYVPLAEVQTNGQLRVPNATEQRRLAFPRLTDLDAGDMGYTTNCGSGLFSSTHDTVKKALDRLCEIAAQHVSYTKPQGGDTSIFKGHNPLTVRQALDLLADVKADDILYTTTKDSSVDNVHEALDVLFNRRAGSGSRVTVGNGGDFGSIGDALNALHAGGNIALELLPGSYAWPPNFDENLLVGDRLSVSGIGPSTRLHVNGNLRLDRLRRFELNRISLVLDQGMLSLNHCQEALLTDCRIEGHRFFSNDGLLHVAVGTADSRTVIRGCTFDTQPIRRPLWVEFVLSPIAGGISDIYESFLTNFEEQIAGMVQGLGTLTLTQRQSIAENIRERLQFGPGEGPPPPDGGEQFAPFPGDWAAQNLHVHEYTAYLTILLHLEAQAYDADSMTMAFHLLRRALVRIDPAAVLVFKKGRGSALLESNDFRGMIGLNGSPEFLNVDLSAVWSKHRNGRITFGGNGELQMRNNRMMGIRVSQAVYDFLQQVIQAPLSGPALLFVDGFRSILLTDNQITEPSSALFANHVQLNSTDFAYHFEPAGWVISETGIYVGNRGIQPTALTDLSRAASAVGNLRLNINRFA